MNERLARSLSLMALLLLSGLMAGCGSNEGHAPADAARNQEAERLRAEAQALPQARAENAEVRRLKAENQELPKFRSQYQEAARLRKENEQLRQQVARISPPKPAAQGAATPAAGQNPGAPQPIAPQQEQDQEVAQVEGAIEEGDEILIDPSQLKVLLPDFDWDKLGRKEPLAVRALLEKDGVQLTNVQQLIDYGITNFVIQPAPPTPQQPQEQNLQ